MQAEPQPAAPAATIEARRETAGEPATARALWPTFMRRTLAEEVVRKEAPALPPRPRY